MALVIVASALPMAVLCTSTPLEAGANPDYSVELVGERDPGAINGVGLTYDVDDVAFGEWIALNVDLADRVRIVTQAEIDAWVDSADMYGFELGLADEGGTRGLLPMVDAPSAESRLALALQRHRAAESQLRQADAVRKQADIDADRAKLERDEAEAEARAASDAVAEQAAARPPPPAPRPQAEA